MAIMQYVKMKRHQGLRAGCTPDVAEAKFAVIYQSQLPIPFSLLFLVSLTWLCSFQPTYPYRFSVCIGTQ